MLTTQMHEVLRHMRAINLAEDASELDELHAVQALATLWNLPLAQQALAAEKAALEARIEEFIQKYIICEPYHDAPAELLLGHYEAEVLGIPYNPVGMLYLTSCGGIPVKVDMYNVVSVKGAKQLAAEKKLMAKKS